MKGCCDDVGVEERGAAKLQLSAVQGHGIYVVLDTTCCEQLGGGRKSLLHHLPACFRWSFVCLQAYKSHSMLVHYGVCRSHGI